MSGWEAHFTQEFMRGGWRLHLWRHSSPGRIDVASGEVLVTTIDENAASPGESGFYLPSDAYQAIVAAINPAPHQAEVNRLEEALAVERLRVDDALRLLWRGPA